MTALVTKHLSLVAGAPDGVKKLRELILDLAIQGRLLPQDPNDEPAEALLSKLTNDRQKQVRSKTIRAAKGILPALRDDVRFSIPRDWAPVRLGEIGDWGAGATPARSNPAYYGGATPWFKSGELTSDLIDAAEESVTDLALKECSLRLNQPGDVLIAMYGATIGKTAILAVPATTNQAVCACTPFEGVYNRFLLIVLKALKRQFVGQGAGGAQPNISKEKIVATAIGLPPELEQHRIVAKVDELMALCDRLEADQADAEAAHAQLVQALLDSLTQVTDAAEFRASWQRLSEHFHTLFTTEASIDALKQTVLQLAVMGKLAVQSQDDEPAEVLLSRIQEHKKSLVAAGALRKQRPLPAVDPASVPYELPKGWTWVRWDSVTWKIGDIDHKMPETTTDGIPFVSPRDFYPGNVIDFDGAKRVAQEDYERLSAKIKAERGDLIYPRYGTIGENMIVDVDRDFLVSYSCAVIKVAHEFIEPMYQFYCSLSACIRRQAKAAENKTTQANVGIKSIQEFLFPLPPLAEQRRIVAKVDELMALCDQLKAQLSDARKHHEKLAQALVERAIS